MKVLNIHKNKIILSVKMAKTNKIFFDLSKYQIYKTIKFKTGKKKAKEILMCYHTIHFNTNMLTIISYIFIAKILVKLCCLFILNILIVRIRT
jgi:hypothetical protein